MRYRHALVVGKFAPLHAGHQFLIETALAEAERVTVLCYANPDFEAMPGELRAGWIRELFPRVDVHVPTGGPPDRAAAAEHWTYLKNWLRAAGVEVDAVFSSESYGEPFARALGASVQHRMADHGRTRLPISGSRIRADVHAHRAWLNGRVYRHFVQMVVFVGAESTGKSTLVEHLAREFDTAFVPEIGRAIWEQKGGQLDDEDYIEIAVRHRQAEAEAVARANRYLFVDTNALTTLLLGHCYGQLRAVAPAVLLQYADECRTRYEHHFVCGDEIAFEQDGVRENEAWRARIQKLVLEDLAARDIAYAMVSGTVQERSLQVRLAIS
ncbi:MAG: AAA family ATPase [Pseudomonadota bacterium]